MKRSRLWGWGAIAIAASVAVVTACSSDDAGPAAAETPDAALADVARPPVTTVEDAGPIDAAPFTGCMNGLDKDCLCGGFIDGKTQCDGTWSGHALCENFNCFCSCTPYGCVAGGGFDSCTCSPNPLGGDASSVHCSAPEAGLFPDAGVDPKGHGSCCLLDANLPFCVCQAFENCESGQQVPSCDLEVIKPLLRNQFSASAGEGVRVDSCNGLSGTMPDDSSECLPPPSETGCKAKGCGQPIECGPTDPKCCNPTCDLATDKCVLKCK